MAINRRPYGWKVNLDHTLNDIRVKGQGAFDELITAQLTPKVQRDFVYGTTNVTDFTTEAVGGTVTTANSMLALQSGGTLYGTAYYRSRKFCRYRPGQGVLFRFTAQFGARAAGVFQLAGAGGVSENALYFGYNPADSRFGIMHQYNGIREVQTLTVSAGAGGAETGTVTLDGTPFNVSLTSGTAAATAQEIAEETYTGWTVYAVGNTVVFLAEATGDKASTFSFSSTGTAAGTFAETVAGAAPTEDWYYQNEWNEDKLDGSGPTKMNLNPQTGNVYQIRLPYLGFGTVEFSVMDPISGEFVVVHRIRWPNNNTAPSVQNPTFAMSAVVQNYTAAVDTTMYVTSMAAFVEGESVLQGPIRGYATNVNGVSSAVPIVSLRCTRTYDGKANFRGMNMSFFDFATATGNRTTRFSAYLNATLTDPLWTSVDSSNSLAHVDTSATAATGGTLVGTTVIGKDGSVDINATQLGLELNFGDSITIVAEPNGTAADIAVGLTWQEDL